jgi:hypothetical protein
MPHAPKKTKGGFALIVSRESQIELLACHLCEIVLNILDTTIA